MIWVRLLIYSNTPEGIQDAMGRSMPDGVRYYPLRGDKYAETADGASRASITILTLKRGGYWRQLWKMLKELRAQ